MSTTQGHPDVNTAFAQYVQSHAFNLSMSRRMIDALADLYEFRRSLCIDMNGSVGWGDAYGTNRSLLARGLVTFHGYPNRLIVTGDDWRRDTRVSQIWEVNHAGLLTLHLLVEAGLVEQSRVQRKVKAA